MALEERTRVREVLFVQDDKTLMWHAHEVPITEVLRDGVVVAANYGPAATLSLAGAGQVLRPIMVSITAQRDALLLRVAELEEELEQKSAAPEQEGTVDEAL